MCVRVVVPLLAMLLLGGCFGIDPNYRPVPHPRPAEAYSDTLPAALIWAHPYPNLLVEIDYVEGREPSTLALDALHATLDAVTDKEEIVIAPPTALPASDARFQGMHDWSTEDLAKVHLDYFDARAPDSFGADETARLHIMYLNGYYSFNSPFHVPQGVLGLQLIDVLLLFPDGLTLPSGDPNSAGSPYPYHERRALVHELGHALGLVNLSIPMQRPHVAEDGVHSNNPQSVMSQGNLGPFALEVAQDNQWLPYTFDADDQADLAAFRELGRNLAPVE